MQVFSHIHFFPHLKYDNRKHQIPPNNKVKKKILNAIIKKYAEDDTKREEITENKMVPIPPITAKFPQQQNASFKDLDLRAISVEINIPKRASIPIEVVAINKIGNSGTTISSVVRR